MEVLNKKGSKFLADWWAETISLILLVIGFIVSLIADSKVISYLVISLCGMMFGRLWYRQKQNFKFTWFLIMLGFLIGYVIGNLVWREWGSTYTIVFLFLFGIALSYYLHARKLIRTAEY